MVLGTHSFITLRKAKLKFSHEALMSLLMIMSATFKLTVKNHMCANMTPSFGAVVTPRWCQCNTMGATVTP